MCSHWAGVALGTAEVTVDRSHSRHLETPMHRPKLFPTTGIAVTAIALTSVAHPNSPPQKNDPQINEHRIQGKTILEEGIRVLKITPAAIQSMKCRSPRKRISRARALSAPRWL